MIRVLIAEDEALTRIGLRFCLDRENSPYQLVGEAENGRQALEMCLKLKPQILITDIKMPEMDGIELIRQIRARELDIKVVILTCYEEFTYLHEAMHLGVDDYLLKVGLQPDRLFEMLEGIRRKHFQTDDARPAASESRLEALESILMGYIDNRAEIERLMQAHHLELNFDRYALMLVDAAPDESLQSYHRSSTLNRGIRAMLSDCINLALRGEAVQCDLGRFAAFVRVDSGDGAQARAALTALAQRMVQVGHQNLNVGLTIGISRLHSGTSELTAAQEEAERALIEGFFDDRAPVCLFGEIPAAEKAESAELPRQALRQIYDSIYAEDDAQMREAAQRFIRAVREAGLRESEARGWYLRACTTAISAYENKTGEEIAAAPGGRGRPFHGMSLQELTQELTRLMDEIARRFSQSAPGESSALIRQVAAYASEHYDENLTLEGISRQFGINISYFCKLFKRIMGVTFVDYLTQRRIQEARRLIRTTDLPTYLIAQKTGFQSPEYFSKTFKKLSGMTPKEYKRAARSSAASQDNP